MFVPIEQVAQHFAVSISTIRAWLRQGKIDADTFIKVGNTYRFNLPAVEASLIGRNPRGVEETPMHPVEEHAEEQLELDFDLDEDV
tara:strand:- start:195 stop:452 length:258 start_codon:yes stop_codon:yes gene_type:complete